MGNIKVLVLSYHSCIRVIKEAVALLRNTQGIDFMFMQTRVAQKELRNTLPNMTYYDSPEMLAAKLRGFKGVIDIVHCHNEPDWMAPIVKEVLPDVPLIYDVHDLATMRDYAMPELVELEKDAMKAADAYVFVSRGYEREARAFHDIPASKPSIVAYSYCFEQSLEWQRFPRLRGICYEGNLVASPDPKMSYRNHLYLAEFCRAHNIPFATYGGEGLTLNHYAKCGTICNAMLPYPKLISNLARWDWGFVGHADRTRTLEYCMPNKMFEYIAAGIPVICCNAPEAGEWAEEHGVGVNITTIHKIPEIYAEHERLRETVEEKRSEIVMENQVPMILDLYEKVLNG